MKTYLSQQATYYITVLYETGHTELVKRYNFLEAQAKVSGALEDHTVREVRVSECTTTIVHVKTLVEV